MSNPVTLPAGTTLGKSFEYGLDINLGSSGTPDWQPMRRMSAWAPTFAAVTSDVGTYDDLGSPNEDVTGRTFAGAFTVQANRSITTGRYLPEVDKLVAAARSKGEDAVVEIRFYHKPETGTPHPTDAGQALVTVELTRQNTGNADTDSFSISLSGKGPYTPIANPFQGWGSTTPIVSAVTPEGAGAGELVTINGSGFLDASGVTFDALPADDFTVVNGASIIAVLPADTAGAVPVVVTTPGGASQAFSYTRGE